MTNSCLTFVIFGNTYTFDNGQPCFKVNLKSFVRFSNHVFVCIDMCYYYFIKKNTLKYGFEIVSMKLNLVSELSSIIVHRQQYNPVC